jgi:HD superfamily phosphohydrolase
MGNLRVVKEPIHNYVPVSDLENALLNDPLFQRLHYVTQNGTAYLTYPSNRTSRLVHSLGAMHIGGLMLTSALFKSDAKAREVLLTSFVKIRRIAEAVLSISIKRVTEYLSNNDDVLYRHYGLNPDSSVGIDEIILLQSVRIACVLHDVGHLPFSHTTETVLSSKLLSSDPNRRSSAAFEQFSSSLTQLRRDQLGSAMQLHENIGTALVQHIFSEISGTQRDFGQMCFWIANHIASEGLSPKNPNGIFDCLHSIMSSKGFDSDRGDYVLRDGYASSFEFGEYDLARILDNLRFVYRNRRLKLVATTTAASALESFFLERYRIYRWLVFHHSVVRGEVAASRALTILLDILFDDPNTDIETTVKNLVVRGKLSRLWLPFSTDIREYAQCDEAWLLSLFRQIYSALGTEPLQRNLSMLRVFLGFILERKKDGFVTLWKRSEEYERFCEYVYQSYYSATTSLSRAKKRTLKGIERDTDQSATQWFNRVIIPFLKNGWDTGEIETMRRIEDRLQQMLGGSGALLLKILKFGSDVECELVDKAQRLLSIQELSSIVENLPNTWNKDIQLRAFWVNLKRQNGGFQLNPSGRPPSLERIGKVFLGAILGSMTYNDLYRLQECLRVSNG